MRSGIFRVLVFGSILVFAPAVGADVCDSINSVANGWTEVANALDNSDEGELADLDVPRLERDVNALLDPTETLGELLVEEGNADEEELGNEILDYVDELRDVEGDDVVSYLVEVIDDIVDTLDDVVDYCDEMNQ